MKIKALIVEDDYFFANLLSDLLTEDYEHIDLLGIGHNGHEGLQLIETFQPELVFLDVEMPDMNGFEMLRLVKKINFQIIFTTAHSQYAIRAIRFNALDYLLKPIQPKELGLAIKRFHTNQEKQTNQDRIAMALFNLEQKETANQVLLLQLQDGEIKLKLSQIVRIEGERNYSFIHLANQSKKLSAKNLAYFEGILTDKGFFRCHKSHLVNGQHITAIEEDTFLVKSKDTAMPLPISRRRKKEAKAWFLELNQG